MQHDPSLPLTLVPARPKVGQILSDYLQLTKPRIMLLLVFTTLTAMMIAAQGSPNAWVLSVTLLSGALAAGGSSALNQVYDRDIDARMTRTARRPIPSGRISPLAGLVFGLSLITLSFLALGLWVNWLAASLTLGGAIYYVCIYTMFLKRNTVVNIIIGGGAGAMPVLVGWAAVTGSLSAEAWLLFAIIFYWTPPHSWALALLVNEDYSHADIPMMPVARGEKTTRRQILLYSILLVILSLLPQALGMLSLFYTVGASLLGALLIQRCFDLLRRQDSPAAKRMWKYSTAYLAFLFLLMIFDSALF